MISLGQKCLRMIAIKGWFLFAVCFVLVSLQAQSQPTQPASTFDPVQMSGIPRPDSEVSSGTIIVRLIQEDFQNKLPSVPVELRLASSDTLLRTVITDSSGRSSFTSLAPGTYQVQAKRGTQTLISQPIQVEAAPSFGVRVMLVFSKAMTTPPAVEKTTTSVEHLYLGGDSHLRIEFQSDNVIQVTERLFLENPLPVAVDPGPKGFEIPLAQGAQAPQIFAADPNAVLWLAQTTQDSPPSVFWKGSIPPGSHLIEVAFLLQTKDAFRFQQSLSLPWQEPVVVMEYHSHAIFEGDLFKQPIRTVEPSGQLVWIIVSKLDLPSGSNMTWTLTLTHRKWIPITTGIISGLLVFIFVVASLLAKGSAPSLQEANQDLLRRREELLSRLLLVTETEPPETTLDPVQSALVQKERLEVMQELEKIYRQLDGDFLIK